MFAALALAGALVIFAFQPVAAQTTIPTATRSFSPMTEVMPGATVKVTITVENLEVTANSALATVKERIPSEFFLHGSHYYAR